MGNNCLCFKKNETEEIFTASKTEAENKATIDYYNKTTEANKDNFQILSENAEENILKTKPEIIIKSKAVPKPEQINNEASIDNYSDENNKSLDREMTKDTKEYIEEPPQLIQFPNKEYYLEYAMDLFDELNKYRVDCQLFYKLMEKHPNITVSKDYAKKSGFEIGWNQKLYDLLSDYLNENNDGLISLQLKSKIHEALHNKFLYTFEINTKELNLEKNLSEFVSRYNSKHQEIFQNDHLIGAISIVKNKDSYRIVLIFA